MVRKALDAFVNRDADLARSVLASDDAVDNMRTASYHELISFMESNPQQIGQALYLLSVVRNLERIADHSTNIAEDVLFLVKGIDVRHHNEERTQRRPPELAESAQLLLQDFSHDGRICLAAAGFHHLADQKPKSAVLPPLYCSTCFGLAVNHFVGHLSSASVSEICFSPSRSMMTEARHRQFQTSWAESLLPICRKVRPC